MSKNNIIYQVYLPSFVKNLKELKDKTDYFKLLGVNYVWLNPVYPSGGKDCGYDITDFCNIDPKYGDLDDFVELLQHFHRNGIKLMLDLIINHTSDKHPWFRKSKQMISPYKNYYNWFYRSEKNITFQSEFEDSPYTYCEETGKYYYHYFYKEQPDLNLENEYVINEIKNIIKFWLDLGVDGFRMDAISCLIPLFKENNGALDDRTAQLNTHKTVKLVSRLRSFIYRNWHGKLILGETEFDDLNTIKSYKNSLDLIMNYRLAYINSLSSIRFSYELNNWYRYCNEYGITPLHYFYNHDRPRQRYEEDKSNRYAILINALLLLQRGSKIIYYGQEINMPNGKDMKIDQCGRDICRYIMPWDNKYKNIEGWLPLIENYKTNNVELQLTVQSSVLNWIIYFIKFQKDIYDILNIDDKEGILSYEIYKNHGVYKLYLSMTNKNVLIDKHDYKYVCRSVSKKDDYEYILPFEIIIYKVL